MDPFFPVRKMCYRTISSIENPVFEQVLFKNKVIEWVIDSKSCYRQISPI